MKLVAKIALVLFGFVLLFYLALPLPEYPAQYPDSVRSFEPADKETPLRRGYYTNSSREQVQEHYRAQYTLAYGLTFMTIKLIHPPEDAQSLIRDQARSTHLVELVHPFRGSLFVNEFIPTETKDFMSYEGTPYSQKVIVKIVENKLWVRMVVGLLILSLIWFVAIEWLRFIPDLFRLLPRLKYMFID